jgi:phage-related protein (TIGR01555 family)
VIDSVDEALLGTTLDAGRGQAKAFDMFRNLAARLGYGTPSLLEATEYILTRLTFDYWLMLTLYENHWLARRIVDAPVQDMLRAWPRIMSDLEPDDLKAFDRTLARTAVQSVLGTVMKWGRLFGGAGALMVIEGHENSLDQPLDLDTVMPGSFKGLIPFDRWSGINPTSEVTSSFEYPGNFNLPEFYTVRAQGTSDQMKVHHTRILRFIGLPVPQPEFQAYSRWGISVIAPVFEELRKHDNMSSAIVNLMYRANILAQKNKQLAGLMSGISTSSDAAAKYLAIMQEQNQLLSSQSMMILPEDGGLESHAYSFGGVADVFQQYQLEVAGAADMPVAVIFGRTLTGLAQSNDADLRIYEQKIAQKRQDELNPILVEQLYPVIMMSEFGEVPEDFTLKYPPLRVLSEEEKADLGTKYSMAITAIYNAIPSYTDKMALQDLKENSELTGIGTNITDEDIERAPDEVRSLGEEDLGMPGEELAQAADATNDAGPRRKEGWFVLSEWGTYLGGPYKTELDAKTAATLMKEKKHYTGETEIEFRRMGQDAAPDAPFSMPLHALPIMIEAVKGSVRYGAKLPAHYGYIEGTESAEPGEEMDVFVNPDGATDKVFIIDGYTDAGFDEHKVMLNYEDAARALADFVSYYAKLDGRRGRVHRSSVKDLRAWLRQGPLQKPYAQRWLYYQGIIN